MEQQSLRAISVTGIGSAAAPADIATITIGVTLLAPSVAQATSAAASLADEIIAALRAAQIDSADIQTADYSVYAEQDHRSGQPILRGYRVNNTVRVTIRDLDKLSNIVERATQAGGDATTVQGITFGLSDERPVRVRARDAAWHDAVAAASQLAELAGTTLGAAINIAEGSSNSPSPRRMMRAASMAESSAPPIEGGETSVSVSLNVTFEAE